MFSSGRHLGHTKKATCFMIEPHSCKDTLPQHEVELLVPSNHLPIIFILVNGYKYNYLPK